MYGWDNEFGTHHAITEAHRVSDKLVSNAAFLKFVLDNGYSKEEFWSKEGWDWAYRSCTKLPKFWVNRSDKSVPLESAVFTLRLTLSETETMPWDWPAEVNCFEA